MILIHRLKKIKFNKAVKETMIDVVFFIVFFILGVCFVFSKIENREERALILKNNDLDPASPGSVNELGVRDDKKVGNFVASSRGKYYYIVGSERANSLVESNKVYFSTEEEAKKQGFKPYSGS